MSMNKEDEIARLKKLMKQFQGIVNTSRDPQTIARSKKELQELTHKLDALQPGASHKTLQKTNSSAKQKSSIALSLPEKMAKSKIFSRYEITPIDASCTNMEVSVIALILKIWDDNFSSAMSEQHVKLYYSHAAERDSHFRYYNNISRSIDILIKVCKDYQSAPNEEFKQQFREVKERSIRQFLYDSINQLEKIEEFWQKLAADTEQGGSICLNQNDTIHLSGAYENKGFLDGKTVKEAIALAAELFNEGVGFISLPNIKKK